MTNQKKLIEDTNRAEREAVWIELRRESADLNRDVSYIDHRLFDGKRVTQKDMNDVATKARALADKIARAAAPAPETPRLAGEKGMGKTWRVADLGEAGQCLERNGPTPGSVFRATLGMDGPAMPVEGRIAVVTLLVPPESEDDPGDVDGYNVERTYIVRRWSNDHVPQ